MMPPWMNQQQQGGGWMGGMMGMMGGGMPGGMPGQAPPVEGEAGKAQAHDAPRASPPAAPAFGRT